MRARCQRACAMPMARRKKLPLHWRAEQVVERLAARILEHQHSAAAFARKRERPHRPRVVQLIPQSVFVGETSKARGRRMRRCGQHGQHGAAAPSASRRPRQKTYSSSAHKNLEVALSRSAEPNGRVQLPPSAGKLIVAVELSSEFICSDWPWTA